MISTATRRTLTARSLTGEAVRNAAGEDLGKIEDLMLDLPTGRIAYAVLSFGGFLGMGNKLFAVPWSSMKLDGHEHKFVLDVAKDRLAKAPGFDKEHWPDMADESWGRSIYQYYGQRFYSE
jgi:sporulation protein YlmC with PRC-barrel domain